VNDRDAANKWLTTAAVVSGTLCIGVTMSMMNLAIPLMIDTLHTDIDTIQWIITGPMLVNVALVPLVTWLTTRLGTRHVYLWAMVIWMAAAVPCGLSESVDGVIFFRLLQGIGGSLHIPLAITVMYQAFPLHQRGLSMGLQQAAHWAAPAIGMTVGGYFLQWHGWPALFFYPIPIGLISIGLASWVLPHTRDPGNSALDWQGLGTLTPALTLLLIGMSQSQRPAWSGLDIWLMVVAGLLCSALFLLVERHHPTPLIALALFHERAFSAASAVYFLGQFTSMGVSFAVIVFLQNALRYSPLEVGFLLLPATVGRVAGELAAGHLSDRWGARGLSVSGLLIFALSCAGLGRLDQQSSRWLIGGLLVLGNAAVALSNSPIIHAGLRSLHDDRISMGSGLLSLVRIIGGTFGVGVVGPLMALAARWHVTGTAGTTTTASTMLPVVGYQRYFSLMAVLTLVTMIPACLVQPRPRRPDR
jgi:EmrB/QacA subfamily drug resistance transporter